MDAGCGFGRLFSTYSEFGQSFVLFDYAQNMLDQAKQLIDPTYTVQYLQGSLYNIPYSQNKLDIILSVRTLHHLNQPELFFKEAYRLLKDGGYFIFEIPNQQHILEIIRFIFKKSTHNPFKINPLERTKNYFNYHPKLIKRLLNNMGFSITSTKNTSFFRHRLLKKIFPTSLLVGLDYALQSIFFFTHFTPSVFVICQKKAK